VFYFYSRPEILETSKNMDEENFATCRICRVCDSDSYISIFDEILNVPIVSLLAELILQEISSADVASTLICTECAVALRRAIKLKRMVIMNEAIFNNPDAEVSSQHDAFLADEDLEFVEKPKADARLIENAYQKMKVEIYDEDQLVNDEDGSDPLFAHGVDLEYPAKEERVVRQKSPSKPRVECSKPVEKLPEAEDEVFSSDDSDDEDFYVDKNFVEPSDDESQVAEATKAEPAEEAEVETFEEMDISCDEEYLEVEPEPEKPPETANLTIKRVLPRAKDRASVLEIPVEQLKFSCCMCHFIAPTETDLKTHLLNHPEVRVHPP
jgi:Zinc-finger associated domain (zf-AD)